MCQINGALSGPLVSAYADRMGGLGLLDGGDENAADTARRLLGTMLALR